MKGKNQKQRTARDMCSRVKSTTTAKNNLDLILSSVTCLPVVYWKPFFFFKGAAEKALLQLTNGLFPATTTPGKTHPVISLKPLPDGIGYKVSPCSSKRPWNVNVGYAIRKGCRLDHTGYVMDRTSYVIDHIEVPIPASLATTLFFKGEIPVACIEEIQFKNK